MRKLRRILPKNSGRDAQGRVAVRHQGGRHKRFLRAVDFARSKRDILGKVEKIEYDPNRNARIALILYSDGERSYILAPKGLEGGSKVCAGDAVSITAGNALPLGRIPVGTTIHNIEVKPGKGGQLARSGLSSAIVQGRENGTILVKLPSGEIKRFDPLSLATIGQPSGGTRGRIGKAGRKRRMGVRPTVRGVAMHPDAHPHGGGEGRSGEGMPPKTPWGKPARGVKTRRRGKYSDGLVVKRRKQ